MDIYEVLTNFLTFSPLADGPALFNLDKLAGGVLEMWNSNLFYFT